MYEKRGNMDIYYLYDTLGNLSAIRYADGTVDHLYYAVCNSRGDVEAFYNGSGTLRARYIYDSWGNVIKAVDGNGKEITDKNSVAYINPIRYRGYYFDSETGLYYLKSRYYDPQVGRFINADGLVSTGQGILGNNMFAYCNNNPVNNVDPTGKSPFMTAVLAGATIGFNIMGSTKGALISAGLMVASMGSSACSTKPGITTPESSYSAKNKDGSYSLYDNQRKSSEDIFHEQILSANVSSPSFSLKDGSATFGSASATLITGGWEFEHVDISLLELGHAEASLGLEDGQFNASAMASVWSPSFSVKFWDFEITLSGHVGAVGGGVSFSSGSANLKVAGGLGVGISVKW